jgi:hypothetical protein
VRTAFFSLVAAAALLLVSPAGAQIVPQRGIAGAKLRMTRAQVVAAKGRPDADIVINTEIVGRERILRYGGTKIYLAGYPLAKARVIAIRTVDPKETTHSGVGVGSTEAEVQAGVGGATCASEYGFSHCRKGSNLRAGNRITDFVLDRRGGEVTSVYVGFVID